MLINCTYKMSSEMQFINRPTLKTEMLSDQMDQNVQRRTANYKPNIWKYDLILSLSSDFQVDNYKEKAQKLKEEVTCTIAEVKTSLSKLELIDSILKLGLSGYFEKEIRKVLETIRSSENYCSMQGDLYAASLCFRLLRQFGYDASQDMFLEFVDENDKFLTSKNSSAKEMLELLEASNLGYEGETLMDEAKVFSKKWLRVGAESDQRLSKKVFNSLRLPLHWRGEWYNIKRHIHEHEKESQVVNPTLVELAKLNFNMLQATQQEDLKEIARWWINLGLIGKLSFSRDRLVESYLYAGGVAIDPQYGSLRKWLSKVINLVLIIDDVYDVYGSLDELQCFTNAVDSWKPEEAKDLPECMKICLRTLFDTTKEIASEIQNEKGWSSVLPYLKKAWADFCKSLLMEAKWYNKGYTPSLEEYLDNGWISSCGPLLSIHIILATANRLKKDIPEFLEDNQEIIHCTSLIIRLCNDQGTSTAEVERGDAPSSIVCYMREANVSEEAARDHIRSIIIRTWKKINSQWMKNTSFPAKYIINTARAAHFMYQHGDGFGVQDRETRQQVLSNLIEPIALNLWTTHGRKIQSWTVIVPLHKLCGTYSHI